MRDFETMEMLWQQDTHTGRFSIDADTMHQRLLKEGRQFEGRVRVRDYIEAVAGLAIAVFFAFVPYFQRGDWAEWQWLLLAAGALFVAGMFLYQRIYVRQFDTDQTQSIRETLSKSMAHVEHQMRLLRNVLWWYCLPIELPLLLVTFTSEAFAEFAWTYTATTVLVMGGIVGYNRWYVARYLKPRQQGLAAMLDRLAADPQTP